MRISKEKAIDVTEALCKLSYDAALASDESFRGLILRTYEEQTPKKVKEVKKEFPSWVYTTGNIRIGGSGFSYHDTSVDHYVVCNDGNRAKMDMSNNATADMLRKAKTENEKAWADWRALKKDVMNTLLTLGTTKRIAEVFPEAIPYLPVSFPPPALNVTNLKNRLAHQPVAPAKTPKP